MYLRVAGMDEGFNIKERISFVSWIFLDLVLCFICTLNCFIISCCYTRYPLSSSYLSVFMIICELNYTITLLGACHDLNCVHLMYIILLFINIKLFGMALSTELNNSTISLLVCFCYYFSWSWIIYALCVLLFTWHTNALFDSFVTFVNKQICVRSRDNRR